MANANRSLWFPNRRRAVVHGADWAKASVADATPKQAYAKLLLDGVNHKKPGIPAGPTIGELLKVSHQARLNEKVKTTLNSP